MAKVVKPETIAKFKSIKQGDGFYQTVKSLNM